MMRLKDVSCGYKNRAVLRDVSFSADPGEVVCILGCNGVGKTTLFKTILGFIPRQAGTICLDDMDVSKISRADFAKRVGYVPQAHTPPFPFSVLEVVVMGRTAHLSLFSVPSAVDEDAARLALERAGVSYLEDRIYTELSGGEQQMVLIARALAAKPRLLIMDEPDSNLDFGNQTRLIRQINKLADEGLAVVMTTHYPDHAFACATKVVALLDANTSIVGETETVLNGETISRIYSIPAEVYKVKTPTREATVCIPDFMENEK